MESDRLFTWIACLALAALVSSAREIGIGIRVKKAPTAVDENLNHVPTAYIPLTFRMHHSHMASISLARGTHHTPRTGIQLSYLHV